MSKWFVSDFETTSVKTSSENSSVWLYGICNSNAKVIEIGNTINKFIEWCERHNNIIVYFHNLKFDGSFILNYLLSNGYKRVDKITCDSARVFSTLIDDMGAFYSIEVAFNKKHIVKFYDSLKLIPLKVSEIAKAFNLEESKGVIDYNIYEINETTINYISNDLIIVAKALKYFKDNKFNKMTIGGCSYNQCRKEIKDFDKLFIELPNSTLETFRKAYRGGRSQVNPLHKNKILTNVKRYDINSMYPYIQAFKELPYGQPIISKTPGKYKFEIYIIDISFKLKNGHLPSLLKTNKIFGVDSYYINSDSIEEIVISNIDFNILKKHYDISFLNFKKIYGFKTSDKIFRDYILKYYNLKSNSSGGMKLLYKLILNNLYGKFGSKHKAKHKIPILENDTLSFKTSELEDMKKYYIPVAIAITSYGHEIIDNAIELTGVNNFIYCDTDSIHTLASLPNEIVDNKEIGKFKLEGIETKSKYVRQKCYVYKENSTYNITCAGLTPNLKDYLIREYKENIFDIFKEGLTINKDSPNIKECDLKLRPKQVKGGILLVPTEFTIRKDKKEYE